MIEHVQSDLRIMKAGVPHGFETVANLVAYDTGRQEPVLSWPIDEPWSNFRLRLLVFQVMNYPFNSEGEWKLFSKTPEKPSPPRKIRKVEPEQAKPEVICGLCQTPFPDLESRKEHIRSVHYILPCTVDPVQCSVKFVSAT